MFNNDEDLDFFERDCKREMIIDIVGLRSLRSECAPFPFLSTQADMSPCIIEYGIQCVEMNMLSLLVKLDFSIFLNIHDAEDQIPLCACVHTFLDFRLIPFIFGKTQSEKIH